MATSRNQGTNVSNYVPWFTRKMALKPGVYVVSYFVVDNFLF